MVFELLNKDLQRLIKKRFKEPTLPQKLGIPPILKGRNVLLIAPVGTGKTESCMLPIFHFILEQEPKPISALYITPLKALNRDLLDRLIWWSNKLEIDISVRHGDTSPYARRLQVEFPPQLLIVTLETLQPILTGKRLREILKNIKWVVIDECLPYDTKITLSDSSIKSIGDLVENNLHSNSLEAMPKNELYVKSLDKNTGEIMNSKVLKVHKIPLHRDMVYIRTKNYNLELSLTSNHPVLVLRKGNVQWISANEVKVSDKIFVVNPLETSNPEMEQIDKESKVCLLDEKKFKNTYLHLFPTKNSKYNQQVRKLEKTVGKLKAKGILPLFQSSLYAPLLARILGHIFGDGWVTVTEKTTSTGFSASPLDLEMIKKDVHQLGFSLGKTYTRRTKSSVKPITHKKHKIEGVSNQVLNQSKSLATLLIAMGSPFGEKTEVEYEIPAWILNSPSKIKREFLSSYLGSEMSTPKGRPHLDFDVPRISIYKREDLVDNAIKLASQLKMLLDEFGIKVSDISVKKGNIRKDGTKTKKVILTISNEEENLLELFNSIGIRYCREKRESLYLVNRYLLAKKFARNNKMKLINKAKKLKKGGYTDLEIGRKLGLNKQYIWTLHHKIKGERLLGFPKFEKWRKLISGDCLIDEIAVVKLTENTEDFVYDLTVEGSHNFIANNIVVHNCHETVDSKRGIQLALGLERLRELAGDFQLIMLSATVGQPKKVAKFLSAGKQVEIIKAMVAKGMDIKVISPKPLAKDRKIAKKVFSSTETASRLRTIMDLIKDSRSTLTFTNTREFAEILASRIKTINEKFPAGIHHSSLSKAVRIKTEKEFKEEKLKSIISTSSLQLGIDIGTIDLVLQYQSPRQITQIIQRVGRSGHELERVSKGIIISTDEDDIFESAVIARKALKEELEPIRFHQNSLDVLAHQLVGLTLEYWKLDLNKVYEMIKRAYPYRNLKFTQFLEVCKQLQRLGLVFLNGHIKKKRRGFQYYFTQLSTIPSLKQYRIFNVLDNSFVGVLDEEFVALHGQIGTNFIVKGESWHIVDIAEDKVLVEPTVDIEAAIPAWEGELIPVPFEVAQEVGKLRKEISDYIKRMDDEEIVLKLKENYPIDENCAKKMIKLIKGQLKFGVVPDDKTILIEDYENLVILHTCFGSLVNQTLGRFLSALLTTRIGSVGLKTDPYRIMFQFQVKNVDLIKEILFNTKPELLRSYLDISLTKSDLFEWKFVHVAKRFGAIARDAEYGKVTMKRIIDDYVDSPIYKETLKEIETEKLDIERATEILRKIQKKEIKVIFKSGLSPLGKIGIRRKYAEVIGPAKPEKEIFELFKQRLLNTKARLVCVNCGQWSQSYVVRNLPKDVKCKRCEARLLGIVRPSNQEIVKIIKKKIRNLPITKEENKKFERVRRTADLYLVYKKQAVICLAARGVGPQTAIRILAKYHENQEHLLRDLLKAERLWRRTKRYWKV